MHEQFLITFGQCHVGPILCWIIRIFLGMWCFPESFPGKKKWHFFLQERISNLSGCFKHHAPAISLHPTKLKEMGSPAIYFLLSPSFTQGDQKASFLPSWKLLGMELPPHPIFLITQGQSVVYGLLRALRPSQQVHETNKQKKNYFNKYWHDLPFAKCFDISTYGAETVAGKIARLLAIMKSKSSNTASIHLVLHHHPLTLKKCQSN